MKPICIALLFWTAAWTALGQVAAPGSTFLGGYGQSLQAPARVATDVAGNVYVTDPGAGQVVVFDPFGRQITTRGGFGRPLGIAVDPQGRIYLAEEALGSVSVLDAQWNLLYKLGIGDGEFQLPNHIALSPASSSPWVYITDSKANVIKVYAGAALTHQFGGAGQGAGQFDFPAGLCLSASGEVFVVDQNNDRCQVFSATGAFLRAFSLGTSNPSGRSQAAFLDSVGRLYVADTFQGIVRVFDAAAGTLLSSVGAFGALPGQLASPRGLALDLANRLFVASANTGRVELYGLDAFLHLTTQPAAGALAAGTPLTFTAIAGGGGLFSYQWQKDGNAVGGATNAALTISGAGLNDAGAYAVVVSGLWGSWTSGVTRVAVLVPPRVIASPQSQIVLRGSNVTMAAIAEGSMLSYQWQLNGLNVAGATNSSLSLPEVQTFQAGLYSVVVSNTVGAVVSPAASLTVLVPPQMMEIVSSTMTTNQLFQLILNADPGYGYSVDASSDLRQWQSISNLTLDAGPFEFIDADATNFWKRFYRLRWVP